MAVKKKGKAGRPAGSKNKAKKGQPLKALEAGDFVGWLEALLYIGTRDIQKGTTERAMGIKDLLRIYEMWQKESGQYAPKGGEDNFPEDNVILLVGE